MRNFNVRVIAKKRINEAIASHPEWKASLNAWHKIVKDRECDWHSFEDVKRTFNGVDRVGRCVVFDIANNRCRLISFIAYRSHKVFILLILTHREYDKGGWKNACDCESTSERYFD
jgi:mRNA interferase HigB